MQQKTLEETVGEIQAWAKEKGIDKAESPAIQALKTIEEMGEIAGCITKGLDDELAGEIGDGFICLIILSLQTGIDPIKAIQEKFDIVSKRKGKTVNGAFRKDS